MSPIENLWPQMDSDLSNKFAPAKTVKEQLAQVRAVWAAFPQEKIDAYVRSFGSKMAELRASKGERSKKLFHSTSSSERLT